MNFQLLGFSRIRSKIMETGVTTTTLTIDGDNSRTTIKVVGVVPTMGDGDKTITKTVGWDTKTIKKIVDGEADWISLRIILPTITGVKGGTTTVVDGEIIN